MKIKWCLNPKKYLSYKNIWANGICTLDNIAKENIAE